MRFPIRSLTMASALLAGPAALASGDLPYHKVVAPSQGAAASLSPSALALANVPAFTWSSDDKRSLPVFLWAGNKSGKARSTISNGTVEDHARAHLRSFAPAYGLGDTAVDTARVANVHEIPGGATVVTFAQSVGQVEVFRARSKVLLDSHRNVVAIVGRLHPAAVPGAEAKYNRFTLTDKQALAKALSDFHGAPLDASALRDVGAEKGGYHAFDFAPTSTPFRFLEPARVKKVYYPVGDTLVAAYFAEFASKKVGSTDTDAYAYVIAADNGRLLHRQNLTSYESFKYRVFADPTGTHIPMDGPLLDFTPHPSGKPDGAFPTAAAPILVTMEGFNKAPGGGHDPWLPPTATETKGNNVDAYTDNDDKEDGFTAGKDLRANLSSPLTFDRLYDITKSPISSPDQIKASVTQIFYTTNWLHDYWYDSGFNEAAGNGQMSNYGRGGVEGDPLFAEAQDDNQGGSRSNANMSSLSDGRSPRMQMYLWTGRETHTLTSASLAAAPASVSAAFGAGDYNLTGTLALAVDGTAPPGDACEAITTPLTGKIAVIDRGTCAFAIKSYNAQVAGAVGVIIVNNATGLPPSPLAKADTAAPITIPVMGVSQEDGVLLKAAILAGSVSIHMTREVGPENDGTIDNAVVAHEWGHYLHHRNVSCGNTSCGGQSEGWADFVATHMIVKEGDNLNGAYPLTIYGTNDAYYGIRRAPYSTDFAVNALTYQHIQRGVSLPTNHPMLKFGDNAEVHNAGEIWASMMHEAHTALLKVSTSPNPRLTWAEAHRRYADYVVAGMQLAPEEPTFTDQRDGILAAAFARDRADFDVLAAAFARRGIGSSATSFPRDSDDLVGGAESYVVKGALNFQSSKIDDSVFSCDRDGYLDAEESGVVTLKVVNSGWKKLATSTATIASNGGVTFPKGTTVNLPALEPFESGTVQIAIKLGPVFADVSLLPIWITASDPEAAPVYVSLQLTPRINFDDHPASSSLDDVESDTSVWKLGRGTKPVGVWSREELKVAPANTINHVWHGIDATSPSDEKLESPAVVASDSEPLVVTLSHRFSFETGPATAPVPNQPPPPDVYWDGAVIEFTTDDGATWTDVATLKDPGYGGTIGEVANTAGNALGGRKGFVGKNAKYPATEKLTVDLGTSLGGKTVKLRFRIASDAASGGFGWEIDDIGFTGTASKPFGIVIPDAHTCVGVPTANAGEAQTVMSGAKVTLDATKSTDPEGDTLSFTWTQVGGDEASIQGANQATAEFVAPEVTMPTTFTFKVEVADGKHSASANVAVLVNPNALVGGGDAGAAGPTNPADPLNPVPTALPTSSGCDCSQVETNRPAQGALVPLFGVLAALLLRRRRR